MEAKVAASKDRCENTSVNSVVLFRDLVAAIKLCVTTSLYALLDSKVAMNCSRVFNVVERVLTIIADALISFPITVGREDLTNIQGRSRDCKNKSQDRNDFLGEHFDVLWLDDFYSDFYSDFTLKN